MAKQELKEYPVDESGEMLVHGWSYSTMVSNEPFEAKMTFEQIYSGAYSKTIYLKDENGKRWYMRALHIDKLLNASVYGVCKGIWIVHKFGPNYFLKLVEFDKSGGHDGF